MYRMYYVHNMLYELYSFLAHITAKIVKFFQSIRLKSTFIIQSLTHTHNNIIIILIIIIKYTYNVSIDHDMQNTNNVFCVDIEHGV